MSRRKVNKEDLLKVGLTLGWDNGYHGVSVKDITSKADVLVGSFYNYFKSKEEFFLALLEFYWTGWEQILKNALAGTELNAKGKFEKLFDEGIKRYRKKQYKQGCFCGMMASELADSNIKFTKQTELLFTKAVVYYEQAIEQGKAEGLIDKHLNTVDTANFIFNSYEGALLRMKSTKSKKPLELCKKMTLEFLFGR